VVGRRSYRNTLTLFRDLANRLNVPRFPLIATDGFEFYEKVVRRVFGPACLYGQVIKTRRNDRVVRVERRTKIGAAWRWEQVLRESEDSEKLNTSFIERLNLTIRQGSAYLCCRTICYARCKERLAAHLELLRCYYNFVRPHRALRFGAEVRTPAVQAGLTTRRITLREIFSSATVFLVWKKVTCVFVYCTISSTVDDTRRPVAA
jgi:IS1 family transposase